MLTLGARNIDIEGAADNARSTVFRLGRAGDIGSGPTDALLFAPGDERPGEHTVFALQGQANEARSSSARRLVVLPDAFDYLQPGDVLSVAWERPAVRVLYRRNSPSNSFLLTERCNHYCLMCSQPPKDVNDDWIVDELFEAIPLIDPDTREIGFTGGEPTLLGDRLIGLIHAAKHHLPKTALHILSNGRGFGDLAFTRRYAAIDHHDVMLGIPIYSASSQLHDYIVQADGAFDETIRGILNLKTFGQRVELRVVIHRANYAMLEDLAEFIARNLTFADHVALMGLEMTGFAKANIDELWVDPVEYQRQLRSAVSILDDFGLRVSIYNHQLCTLDRAIWPFAVKSISDWKNEYRGECSECIVADQCGGFFATGRIRQSSHITAIRA